MSFKLKKWGEYRTVNMAEFVPGISPIGGNSTSGYAIAWGGRILVLAYDASGDAIYCIYDPASHSVSGPFYPPERSWWNFASAMYGNYQSLSTWGSRYLLFSPRNANSFHYGSGEFFGFDASLTMFDWKLDGSMFGAYAVYPAVSNPGYKDGMPTVLVRVQDNDYDEHIYRVTPAGYTKVWSAPPDDSFKWYIHQGIRFYSMTDVGPYVAWQYPVNDEFPAGLYLYTAPPVTDAEAYAPIAKLDTGVPMPTLRSPLGYLVPTPGGGGAYGYFSVDGVVGWRNMDSPLGTAERPWSGHWDWQRQEDGRGYALDEWDLDGTVHHWNSIDYFPLDIGSNVTFHEGLGWYISKRYYTDPVSFTVYALDPFQPTGRTKNSLTVSRRSMAWAGDYAVRDDLALEHVLPLPGGGVPSGGSLPPDERTDGHILTKTGLYVRTGNKITYKRGIKVDMSAYPTTSPDWWFPGMEGTTHPGFWHLFGGSPIAIGRMPDPSWGMLDPMGNNIMYGLGAPAENLRAEEPTPTHVLRNSDRISGTTAFVTPSGDTQVIRRSLTDDRCSYCEFGMRQFAPPYWRARVGRIQGKTWTTLIDFNSMPLPGLGETDWTIWSVVPIPKCRALREGGWLVGATLYFDPWASWEQTVGGRTATFKYKNGMDSGRGWVPCCDGYIGPIKTPEAFQPVYLAAYDEWTTNRSYYGPDVLLVYDNDGTLVECLNSPDIYPPDGWAVAVVPGTIPKVIYNVSRSWAYSDNAEGWGQYHGFADGRDIQTPLFVCYDLEDATGRLVPGMGTFRGFVDMHVVGDYDPKNATWRWDTCAPSIYNGMYPLAWWAPGGRYRLGAGIGGTSITIMSPRAGSGRSGVKGVGRRA